MTGIQGKLIFITGGNAGMGLAVAKLFAREGCAIAIAGRRESENQKAVLAIRAEGAECAAFTGDVTDEVFIERAVNEACETAGGLHFAFNSAGVNQPEIALREQSVEDFRRIIDINVMGTWLAMRAQVPLIASSGGGCVVNNSSMVGLVGKGAMTLYTASKHAVNGLTKSVALEYATQGVRVNAICAGPVRTDLYPELMPEVEAMQPIGRSSTPEEIAATVLYLCKDATTTTGQCLALDGGYTAQ
jgi:NAD(P)-dependent dehydrogenase (short-subunit alcohol dehydrogenase family)